jgi:hypothetical protein
MILHELPHDAMIRIDLGDDRFIEIKNMGKRHPDAADCIGVEVFREKSVVRRTPANASVVASRNATYVRGNLKPAESTPDTDLNAVRDAAMESIAQGIENGTIGVRNASRAGMAQDIRARMKHAGGPSGV